MLECCASKDRQRWYQLNVIVIKSKDNACERLRGRLWHVIKFSKLVIIETRLEYSEERKVQKAFPRPNLEARECAEELIYQMTRGWEGKSGELSLEINQ